MEIILASQSPRRRELLGYFTLPFRCVDHRYDEEALVFEGDIRSYVTALCEGKAKSILSDYPNQPILAADTVVFYAGKIFGKPRDAEHAYEILKELAGTTHTVLTGVSLAYRGTLRTEVEETRVTFNNLTEAQARSYHSAIHCFDKAAGYAIQEAGTIVVKRIDGCYYNVMGLPLNSVEKVLAPIGLSLWNHLPSGSQSATTKS